MGERLIEVAFPIKEVSEHSRREKNIRHGHISTLHIWWARKPLAASRATAFAALIPAPNGPKDRERLLNLVKRLAPWESSLDKGILAEARELIRQAHGGPLKVLDPFAGGGAIPLEALRLGCETYALDYNPVAVLILKAVLEYPQKFGHSIRRKVRTEMGEIIEEEVNPLLEAVQRWGKWVLEEARKELAAFYPPDPDGSIPVGYIWARTLPCQNPACGTEIPLMYQTWLAKKDKRRVALRLLPNRTQKRVDVEIVEGSAIDSDPKEGTVSRAHVRCPVCGGTIDDGTTRRLFREGKAGQRLMAVVLSPLPKRGRGAGGGGGKRYRLAAERDLEAYRAAERALEEKRWALWAEWGLDPVPDEPTPLGGGPGAERAFSVHKYGLTRWGDLFNARQKLALITFAEKVRRAHAQMLEEGAEPEFAKVVTTYLAITFNRFADKNANLVVYDVTRETVEHVFGRQALPMVWNYIEANPFADIGWPNAREWVELVLTHLTRIPPVEGTEGRTTVSRKGPQVHRGSATALPWPDNFFDAVYTDPPYYDCVPYADLSDFFYVWLKRTVGDLYPDLFATPLTPKSEEMVADASKAGGMDQAKRRFEQMLTQALREIRRVLKPEGIAVVVFAHKTTEAWETIINALLQAGLYLTASWPIHTEMEARLRAQESAALASSIYMVCRKRTGAETADFGQVQEEIRRKLEKRLAEFWAQGIRGADFFMSAIGPAVEVFGKYERVLKLSGETVSVRELLDIVRWLSAEFAVRQILENGHLSTVDPTTQFYLLWRWSYGRERVPFDEARKLAQARGVSLEELEKAGLLKKQKDLMQLLAPQERKKWPERFTTMIDALQQACVLWKNHQTEELDGLLNETYGALEVFWQVANAIAGTLPEGDEERRLLHGLQTHRRPLRSQKLGLFST